jgi:hypothetical protein
LHDPQQESRLIGMSDNQYRQWNGAQWMVWDGAQWLPERQPYQPAKPISDKTRVLAAVIAIAFFVGVMVVGTFVAADLMK